MQRTVRSEHHFQQNFAFQLQIAGFIGINRLRLEGDFHRRGCGSGICLRQLRSTMNHLLRTESTSRNAGSVTAAVALASAGNAVAEVGARYRPFNAFRAACSVPLSGTCGHIKSTSLCGIQLGVWLAGALQTVGISEASSLHFLHGYVDSWSDRAASEITSVQKLDRKSVV